MLDALRIIRFSLSDFWDELVLFIALNVLWALALVLPLSPWLLFGDRANAWFLPLTLVLALPLPLVSAGLCYVANQATRAKAVSLATFARGVRRYWAKSLVVALINIAILALIANNLRFYALVVQGAWANVALSLWLVVGFYWLLVQIYWFPMILEMEDERVLPGLRNALTMVFVSPGFTITLGLVILLLGVAALLLTVPAVMLLASLLLLVANHATRSRLARIRKKPYRPGPE